MADHSRTVVGRRSAPPDRARPGSVGNALRGASPAEPSGLARNPGCPLDLDWALAARVNRLATDRRVAEIIDRPVDHRRRLEWLLRCVGLIDLTTLSGDDTPGSVRRLCATARRPIDPRTVERITGRHRVQTVASVCVYQALIGAARAELAETTIPVCAVSAGFPAGQIPLELKVEQVRAAAAAGAGEIDVVIGRAGVITGRWEALFQEVKALREAAGPAKIKTILATGELPSLTDVMTASRVCLMAGSDFIKTSTGNEAVNATLPVGVVMMRAVRDYRRRTGVVAGFKPAGGIRTAAHALTWMNLVAHELGESWLAPDRFRFGASSLLGSVVETLEREAPRVPQ